MGKFFPIGKPRILSSISFLNLTLQVAMLDIGALSILFLTDAASETSSPITSLGVRSFLDAHGIESRMDSQSEIVEDSERGVLFITTRNAHIIVRDVTNGKLISSQPLHPKKDFIAISMYIIGKYLLLKIN